MKHHRLFSLVALTGMLALSVNAAGQTSSPQLNDNRDPLLDDPLTADAGIPPSKPANRIRFRLGGGVEHRFDDGIKGGAKYSVTRAAFGVEGTMSLQSDLEISFGLGYRYDNYDFSGDTLTALGGTDPWSDVHTLQLGVGFSYNATSDWTIFTGAFGTMAGESDADWGDALAGGGFLGTTFQVSNDLTVGAGFAVASKIADGVQMQPIIILNWQITDQLSLGTSGAATPYGIRGVGGRSMVELMYRFNDEWEFALGAGYYHHRFRLDDDDDGASPDGVGVERASVVSGRISFNPSPSTVITVYGGMTFEGEMDVEDEGGTRIFGRDTDDAAIAGASVSFRF